MSDGIQATLLALKDIQGVQGSFVIGGDGALMAMQMPPLFDAAMFTELGPRIERLSETFSALGDELESCMVRFTDHVLCVKRFSKGGALCILANYSVSVPALRMAMNLADRRLAGTINGTSTRLTNGSATAVHPAGAAAIAVPVPAPASVPPAPAPQPKVARYYRGHLVED